MSNPHVAWDRDGNGITMEVLDEMFVEHCREEDDLVEVKGFHFYPIDIVKELDPAAYRGMRGTWLSDMEEDERLFDTQEACEQWRMDNGYE